jgi:hypothetical protein
VEVDLVGLFGDLVRLETDLWNRVDTRIREEHGLALAWLEPMQIISATPDCRVLHIADALFITVGRDKQACRQDRSQRMVQSATESHRRPLESNRIDAEWPGSSPRSQRHFHRRADYIGAAAPASDLNQLSSSLRRLRRHLMITADRPRPAGGSRRGPGQISKEEQS